ncbi:MAG: hypothetical protein JXA89_08120 [Anaerolineae bacterium]|nr:hypothetical protein [Anaerolineae bacterium]
MSQLCIYVLGGARVEVDGQIVRFSHHKSMALLVYLAINRKSYSRARLAGLFWPTFPDQRARQLLNNVLTALKKGLGPGCGAWLDTDVQGSKQIGLKFGEYLYVDVHHFQDLLAACRAHDHPDTELCARCHDPLAQARALYRGDFLKGIAFDSPEFDDWQSRQMERLRAELTGVVLNKLICYYSAKGLFHKAVEHVQDWLEREVWNESAHLWLVKLYTWQGNRPAALKQCDRLVAVVRDEFDAPPGTEALQVIEQVRLGGEVTQPYLVLPAPCAVGCDGTMAHSDKEVPGNAVNRMTAASELTSFSFRLIGAVSCGLVKAVAWAVFYAPPVRTLPPQIEFVWGALFGLAVFSGLALGQIVFEQWALAFGNENGASWRSGLSRYWTYPLWGLCGGLVGAGIWLLFGVTFLVPGNVGLPLSWQHAIKSTLVWGLAYAVGIGLIWFLAGQRHRETMRVWRMIGIVLLGGLCPFLVFSAILGLNALLGWDAFLGSSESDLLAGLALTCGLGLGLAMLPPLSRRQNQD